MVDESTCRFTSLGRVSGRHGHGLRQYYGVSPSNWRRESPRSVWSCSVGFGILSWHSHGRLRNFSAWILLSAPLPACNKSPLPGLSLARREVSGSPRGFPVELSGCRNRRLLFGKTDQATAWPRDCK